jgi:hypothetical protein
MNWSRGTSSWIPAACLRGFSAASCSKSGPPGILPQFACSGEVQIRVLHGFRTVALSVAAVAPNCTFSAQTVLTRKPGHGPKRRRVSLVVLIHLLGNGYLAPAHAHPELVVVG